jgi:hypothetical protein
MMHMFEGIIFIGNVYNTEPIFFLTLIEDFWSISDYN